MALRYVNGQLVGTAGSNPEWIARERQNQRFEQVYGTPQQQEQQAALRSGGIVGGISSTRRGADSGGQVGTASATGFSPPPQFYGTTDFDALQQSLFQEQMAGVSSEFGRRGMLSSSEFGGTTAAAMSQAQRTRWGLETQEQARRTRWEQDEATRQWREREAQAQRDLRWRETQARLSAQRESERLAVQKMQGSMQQSDFWALQEQMGQYASAPSPQEQAQQQQFQQQPFQRRLTDFERIQANQRIAEANRQRQPVDVLDRNRGPGESVFV